MKNLRNTKDKAVNAGEEIGKLEAIGPILTLYEKGEGDRDKIFPLMSFFFQQFKRWLLKQGKLDTLFKLQIDALITRIEREII